MPAILALLFNGFAAWLMRALGVAIGTTLITVLGIMFSDVILGLIGQVINLLVAGVNATGITLPSLSTSVASLPPIMLQVMKRLRFDDAMGILVSAVAVRSAAGAFSFVRGLRRGAGS